VDAAGAGVPYPDDVDPPNLGIGLPVDPPVDGVLYLSVRKHGRTTGHTVGVVVDIAADINVQYGAAGVAAFEDQLGVVGAGEVFSDGGDSGSLLVDGIHRHPVGLLFAGARDLTFANPVVEVLDELNASVVGQDGSS
jgi:hypothetical protein